MSNVITCFLLFSIITPACSQLSQDPNTFKMITTDVGAFWKAFDEFKTDTSSNPFAAYLRNGSPGLQEFRQYRIYDSARFKKIIKAELSYFESIRASSQRVTECHEQVRIYFSKFKEIYPHAQFPDIYFVVGQLNTAVTVSPTRIFIGTELYSDQMQKNSFGDPSIPLERLPIHIVGGLAYLNQKPAPTGYTLLWHCIVQGSADFLTTLVLGDEKHIILDQINYVYGEQHEELLVREFLKRKTSEDLSGWLYNRPEGERPANLGNWIGFKITEAYYNNSPDKKKAIDEIFKINDFEKFLLLSGYVEPFRNN